MSRLLIHLSAPTGTILVEDDDAVTVGAEVSIQRLASPTLTRMEPAVIDLLKAIVPVTEQPETIADASDAASGDLESAYGVLWIQRGDAEAVNETSGMGTPWPDVRETCLLWARVERGDADHAYEVVRAAVNALVEYRGQTL